MYQRTDQTLNQYLHQNQWVHTTSVTTREELNKTTSKPVVEQTQREQPYVPPTNEELVPIETGGCVYYVPATSPISDISLEQAVTPSFQEFVPYAHPSIPNPSQNDYSSLLAASFSLLSHSPHFQSASEFDDRIAAENYAHEGSMAPDVSSHFLPNNSAFARRLCGLPPFSSSSEFHFNLNAKLRDEFTIQKMCTLATGIPYTTSASSSSVVEPQLPTMLQGKYFGFRLLDSQDKPHTAAFCGFPTVAYKALSTEDSKAYLLRRVDGFNLSNFDLVKSSVERWSQLNAHSCIVHLRQAFATRDFPDSPGDEGCLVYVYDYYPNVITLEQAHFKAPLSEFILWRYIIQIVLALAHIHSAGLAARVIHPSKILVSYRYRIRLNCVGLLEATRHDVTTSITDLQNQDFLALAQLILVLGCGSMEVSSNISKSLDQMFTASSYSSDMENFVYLLLSKAVRSEGTSEIHNILQFLSPRIYQSLENSWMVEDILESELKMEIENDRLFRILCKINIIVDRVAFAGDANWAETGNRYIVKLFRDYVFHQTDEATRPILDLGHMVDCLNKVDVGTMEKIMLMSQDGSSIFIVSYADIKECIEKSFVEVVSAAIKPLVVA